MISLLIKFFLFLVTLQVTPALASPSQGSWEKIRRALPELAPGFGSINGQKFPISTGLYQEAPDQLLQRIYRQLDGILTVSDEPTPYGIVVSISDVRSTNCPTCERLTKDIAEPLLNDTLTFTILRTPAGSLIFGSKAGDLANLANSLAPAYRGGALPSLAHATPVSEVVFAFGDFQTYGFVASDKAPAAQWARRISRDLTAAGFSRSDSYTETGNAPLPASLDAQFWTRSDQAISLTITQVGESTAIQVQQTFHSPRSK